MKIWTRLSATLLLAPLSLATWVAPAAAHIRISAPEPRVPDNDSLKASPCGPGTSWGDGMVHEYAPGDPLTITWTETIPHAGYFRLILSMTGDAGAAMPTQASYDAYNDTPPAEVVGPVTEGDMIVYYDYHDSHSQQDGGGERTLEITLPQATCTECTLQLIQMMADGQPYSGAYYYGCVDLTIAGEVSGGAGGASAVGGAAAEGGSGGEAGMAGSGALGGGSAIIAPAGGMGGQVAMGGMAGMATVPLMPGPAGQGGMAAGGMPSAMIVAAGSPPASGGATTTGTPALGSAGTTTAAAGAAGMAATGTTTAPASCAVSGRRRFDLGAIALLALALVGMTRRRAVN